MPAAPSSVAVPTVQRDDAAVCVTRWDFAAGASTGWHRHEFPYFVVMLTDALMRIDNGSDIVAVTRRAGETYSRPAGVEHDVTNGGEAPMAFVEIEIKRDGGRLVGG